MKFEKGVSLKRLGSYRIGGEAAFFKEAANVHDLAESLSEAKRLAVPFFILGGGTNILFSDEGFGGVVIKPSMGRVTVEGETLKAGAGVLMSELTEFAAMHGLSGLEWAGGLPGTLGGAIRGNAGAFHGEIKDAIKEVISLDTSSLKVIKRISAECAFNYRTSVFKTGGREVIIEATLALAAGDKGAISKATQDKIQYRKERHPMEHPNVGSVFKNVPISKYPHLDLERFSKVIKQDPFPVIPTAFLLSLAGLKGVSCRGAMISPKHPNFIVNVLDASSRDVKSLIELVKYKIFEEFGMELEEEIQILSETSS